MSEVVGSIWWYLVTIGVLVTFHEFGHFWVARRCGVKVLKFSIGFGKSLWSRTGKDGTVYSIGAIPLGGYVSMLDERVEDVPADQRHMAHNNKSNAQKIAIAAAGPGFNFLLAVLAFWVMFSIGKPDYQPVLGESEGLAAEAGLVRGTRVLAVDGTPYSTWSEVFMAVIEKGLYRRDTILRVREADGDERDVTLALSQLPADMDEKLLGSRIGLQLHLPAVVGKLTAGDPAERAGIKVGDEFLAINDRAVVDFGHFRDLLSEEAARNPALRLKLIRGGNPVELAVTARANTRDDGTKDYVLGFYPQGTNASLRYNPVAALPAAVRETWTTTTKTVGFLADMLRGLISPKHLSGPITIARVANAVAQDGLAWFLGFLAAVSVGIAILNLLPIPILDGGHILSYLIESLKGSPLSEKSVMVGQYLGLGALACLIGLALFNDFTR
jgi:regulator of sigma E protease